MLKNVNAALKVRGQCQGQGQKTWPLDASRPRAGLEDYITARHSPHSSVKMRINALFFASLRRCFWLHVYVCLLTGSWENAKTVASIVTLK